MKNEGELNWIELIKSFTYFWVKNLFILYFYSLKYATKKKKEITFEYL